MRRNILKKFLTYGAGNVLQSGLSFLLLPLYLMYFMPQEYGVIATLTVIVAFLTLLLSCGVTNGLVRLYYEFEGLRRKELVGNTIAWYLIVATVGGVMLYASSSLLSLIFFHTRGYEHAIRILALLFFSSMLMSIPLYILRLEKKAVHFVAVSLFSFLVDFALKLYFIVYLKRGVNGYFESSVVAKFLSLAVATIMVSGYVRISIDASIFKQLLRLGTPYIVSGLAMWTLDVSDRLILIHFSGEAAVGIYALAYNFANLFGIFLATPIAFLIDPFFFSHTSGKTDAEKKQLLRRMLIYYIIVGSALYLAIAVGSGDALRVFTMYFGAKEQYLDAAKLVPIIVIAPLLYFIESQATLAALLIKKPEIISLACAAAAVFNFLLNLIIIPHFAAVGAAITTVLAYLLLLLLAYWLMEREYAVGYQWSKIMLLVCYLLISLFIGLIIRIDEPVVSFFVKTATALLTFLALALFTGNILNKHERDTLHIYFSRYKKRIISL